VIRLLAVDDSALMRRLLAEVFSTASDITVTFARNGVEALAVLDRIEPDVVTLDINMPEMDGLTCLDRIMVQRPCPVVMFSTLTADGAEQTLKALSLGAVDYVLKPGGAISLKLDEFGPVLIEKVRTASQARLSTSHRLSERVRLRVGMPAAKARKSPATRKAKAPGEIEIPLGALQKGKSADRLVLVGCSTGGPPALDMLLEPLPATFPWPIVIAQHMPASFTGALADRLDRLCALEVVEVTKPMALRAGCVYVARGDADILISRRRADLIAMPAPLDSGLNWHPSVDRMVDSAMRSTEPGGLIGVLMTGMGYDGAAAMTRLHQSGGCTIAESEESAVVWGMPGELVRAAGADMVVPVEDIAPTLLRLVAGP
jgi:two-component system chemotaxis response regulator CheB